MSKLLPDPKITTAYTELLELPEFNYLLNGYTFRNTHSYESDYNDIKHGTDLMANVHKGGKYNGAGDWEYTLYNGQYLKYPISRIKRAIMFPLYLAIVLDKIVTIARDKKILFNLYGYPSTTLSYVEVWRFDAIHNGGHFSLQFIGRDGETINMVIRPIHVTDMFTNKFNKWPLMVDITSMNHWTQRVSNIKNLTDLTPENIQKAFNDITKN